MRIFVLIFCSVSLLFGCSEIDRKANFEVTSVQNPEAETNYLVTGHKVTPEVVSRANKSAFIRFVTLGGNSANTVKRVPESRLFSGPKPKANAKPDYLIGVGDKIDVARFGLPSVTYLVQENGAIDLREGRSVVVQGLSVSHAEAALKAALRTTGVLERSNVSTREFPTEDPPEYELGVGDVIRVSRLTESPDGNGHIEQVVQTTKNSVDSNGIVSILMLGEIEVAGFTLREVRDRVLREAVRTTSSLDTLVEIEAFKSQSVFVLGDLGTRLVELTTKPLTYDRLIADLNPSFKDGRDYLVTLERDGAIYQMSARSIISDNFRDRFYVFDGDRVKITELQPSSEISLSIKESGANKVSYIRVLASDSAGGRQSKTIPLGLRGMSLRQLLIEQGIDVNQNKDLLVRLVRSGTSFNLSAQSILLKNSGPKYWLAPGDHVIVEDIAYIGDNALLVGEIRAPRQLPIDRNKRTTLSQALFDGGVFSATDADFKHVYVLRGQDLEFDAYHFDITQILNLSLAEDFELRPGDIMFVRTRPLSRYSRSLALALGFFNALDVGLTNSRSFGR